MFAEVIRLRRDGMKLEAGELAQPSRGRLCIYSWTQEDMQSGQRRMVKSARLAYGYAQHFPDSLPPLNEVQITRMDGRGFVLVGMETMPNGSFKQAWAVVPMTWEERWSNYAQPPEA